MDTGTPTATGDVVFTGGQEVHAAVSECEDESVT
jgi:hypothetical protein